MLLILFVGTIIGVILGVVFSFVLSGIPITKENLNSFYDFINGDSGKNVLKAAGCRSNLFNKIIMLPTLLEEYLSSKR